MQQLRDAARSAWTEDRLALLVASFSLVAGIGLRLSFPGDIEYKGDERWMFNTTMGILRGAGWPGIGMDSSVGISNPGLSVWVFPAIAWLTRASTPVELARAVALLNSLAVVLLFGFAWTRPSSGERRLWLWTTALAAVDPLGILLQRKIWAQSVLPIFALALFLSWRSRASASGAFFWGIAGAVIGQVHMSGFFYAAIFVAWALLSHLRGAIRVRWGAWLAGSVLGSLPLIPWLLYLEHTRPKPAHWPAPPPELGGNVWRLWMEDVVGWNLNYSLGNRHFEELRRWPVNGAPTHLVAAALWTSIGVAILLGLLLVWQVIRTRGRSLAPARLDGPTAHNLAFGGYGLLMNLLPLHFYRHYLILVFPFESMTLPLTAWVAGGRFRWLGIVWAAHLIVAVCLLFYLHVHHGAPGSDYGVTYEFQFQRRR
jgi:hypothetical protein